MILLWYARTYVHNYEWIMMTTIHNKILHKSAKITILCNYNIWATKLYHVRTYIRMYTWVHTHMQICTFTPKSSYFALGTVAAVLIMWCTCVFHSQWYGRWFEKRQAGMKDDSQVYQNLERLARYNPKCTSQWERKEYLTLTHVRMYVCIGMHVCIGRADIHTYMNLHPGWGGRSKTKLCVHKPCSTGQWYSTGHQMGFIVRINWVRTRQEFSKCISIAYNMLYWTMCIRVFAV